MFVMISRSGEHYHVPDCRIVKTCDDPKEFYKVDIDQVIKARIVTRWHLPYQPCPCTVGAKELLPFGK